MDAPVSQEVHMSYPGEALSYPFGEPDRLTMHPEYRKIRESGELARVRLPYGKEGWLVTRYEDVHRIMTDPRFSRELAIQNDEPRTYGEHRDMGMLDMDPPRHTRIRQIVASAFTPRRTEQVRPHTIAVADKLIDEMLAGPKPADLVESFAKPLPVTVICEMFGLPIEDRARFSELAEAMTSTDRLSTQQIVDYLTELWTYLAQVITDRRNDLKDDALSALIVAGDEDRLSEHEIAQIAAGQLAASYETTANELASFIYALMTHPEQHDQLWMNPSLVDKAVEELLRWVPMSSSTLFARYATEDVVIGNTVIHAGEHVLASLTSANKDDSVFDKPDELNLTAVRRPHLAFSSGVHRCLGTGLARMILQVGVGAIIRRMPGLQLAVREHELVWKQQQLMRALRTLPVTW